MSPFSPIHHTFAPLGDREQRKLARHMILGGLPTGSAARDRLRSELARAFHGEAFLFASGREALLAALRTPLFAPGDEIIVQAYTCVVVPNAIKAAGLVPVYVDVNRETLNLDPWDLERRITPKTRAVICQHTFGIPADTEQLRLFCDERNLLLIEDCAHVLPDAAGPSAVGATGDLLLLSFGRDKAISGVSGGAIVSRLPNLSSKLREAERMASTVPTSVVRRWLWYPLLYAIARPLYGLGIGRLFLAAAKHLRWLVPIVTRAEKKGAQDLSLRQMPEPCAILALAQWKKLALLNAHRRRLTSLYMEEAATRGWPVLHGLPAGLALQKFPLFVKGAERIRQTLRKTNVHLHDGWTGCVVCPAGVDIDETRYRAGQDPQAERVCEEILSLPTHPGTTEHQARRLAALVDAQLRAA